MGVACMRRAPRANKIPAALEEGSGHLEDQKLDAKISAILDPIKISNPALKKAYSAAGRVLSE